jgi:nuclear pore complex protein Nup205
MQVLEELWSSSLSVDLTMIELRRHQFLQTQFISQSLASQDNVWDECTLMDPEFWYTQSAEAIADFLTYRACLYEYTVAEMEGSKASGLVSLQKAVMATIVGKSKDMDGSQIPHLSLLELFDFADLDIQRTFGSPELRYFGDIDFESLASLPSDEAPVRYDIGAIHETLQQRLIDLTNRDQAKTRPDEEWETEAELIIAFFEAENRWVVVQSARSHAMHMWSEAVIGALDFAPVEPVTRLQFILRTLEVILPKIDAALNEDPQETLELARVGEALLDALSQLPASQIQGRVEANALEKLFQLFRSCLEGISTPTSTPALRALLYPICSRYLGKITSASQAHSTLRRNAMDCLRGAGMPLISVLSDDADEGDDDCKLSSLELLSILTSLSRSEKSIHVLECFVKVNALEIIIEPLKHIAVEFQDTEAKERAVLLDTIQARLLLLLQISRTREGSGQLIDSGMLQAIRESMLFRADPDLGIDLDNAQALHNYYELVSLTLRVLVSTFVNRGLQNEQCQYLIRTFLLDHRPNMVGLFKRFNGFNGTVSPESQPVLRDIVRAYTALASMTSFVEV